MGLFSKKTPSIIQSQHEWRKWEASNIAHHLAALEQAIIDPLMERTFGHQLLQISIAGSPSLHQNSPIVNKAILHFSYPVQGLGHALISEPEYLAIANEHVDVLILHHVLEFSNNPHQVLREAQRVLSAGGYLFVVGFNPWSLWALKKAFALARKAPWNGNYLSYGRISDWMRLLDFNLQNTQFGFFKFPASNEQFMASCDWLEQAGQKYNCFFGGFYVMVARKQILGVTPLRSIKTRRRIIPFPVTEPTTRSSRFSD